MEIIASGIAQTENDLEHFFKCTLLYLDLETAETNDNNSKTSEKVLNPAAFTLKNSDPIKDSMQFLEQYEFIRVHFDGDKQEKKFIATRLGYACLGLYIS